MIRVRVGQARSTRSAMGGCEQGRAGSHTTLDLMHRVERCAPEGGCVSCRLPDMCA